MIDYSEIEDLDKRIKSLSELDDQLSKEEFRLYQEKKTTRTALRDLRAERRSKLAAMRLSPGRRRTISIPERRRQVAKIKSLREKGMPWKEVEKHIGKHYTECLRIVREFGHV